jgi:hypothetical protein
VWVLLVGLSTIVLGDNNNEVLLVSWYWYILYGLGCYGGTYRLGASWTEVGSRRSIGRWDGCIPTGIIDGIKNVRVCTVIRPIPGSSWDGQISIAKQHTASGFKTLVMKKNAQKHDLVVLGILW